MKWHACSRLFSIGACARRLFVLIAIIALLSAALPARAAFAECGLDPTFGAGGVVNVSYEFDGDTYTLVGMQVGADGKIVVLLNTGLNYLFARYNADGSLDTTFGTNGIATTGFAIRPYAFAIQPDGKIVVAGSFNVSGTGEFAVERLNANGTLDTSFGAGGMVITTFTYFNASGVSTGGTATSIAILPNGNIVAAGYDHPFDNVNYGVPFIGQDVAFAVYDASGNVLTQQAGLNTRVWAAAQAVVAEPDNTFVVAGYRTLKKDCNPPEGCYFFPEFDPSAQRVFVNGVGTETDFPGDADAVLGLAAQGSLLVALVRTTSGVYLTRFTGSGALDTSFGSNGLTPVSGAALAVQPDGKIVVAGDALYRFNSNGTPDTSFGSGGVIASPIGALLTVGLQPQGQIIAANSTQMARFRCVSATTPQDATRAIINQVGNLEAAGVLNHGNANALTVKLDAAINQMDRGNRTAAANQLQAFVNQVNALLRSGRLSSAQAQELIGSANAVIAGLSH